MMTSNDTTYSEEMQDSIEPIIHNIEEEDNTIIMGADHRGYELKEHLRSILLQKKFEVMDVGTHDNESCDYPSIAHSLCNPEIRKPERLGVLINPLGQAGHFAVESPPLGLERFRLVDQLALEEFAVGAFMAQFGVEREVELPLIGQLLLDDAVTALENVGAVARPGQFRLHLLELGLGSLGPVQEILEIFPVAFAEDPPLVPPAKAKPAAGKPKAGAQRHDQNHHSCPQSQHHYV